MSGRPGPRRLWLIASLVLVVAGCFPASSDPVVDTWPVGPVICPGAGDVDCTGLLAEATDGLAKRNPRHAEVIQATLHSEGRIVEGGVEVIVNRSGNCCYVARFELEDGTVRAIGVGYPGISTTPIAIDYGP